MMSASAAAVLDRIDEALDSGRFEWARSTLVGVYATVKRKGVVTDAQERTVENILSARQDQLPSERLAAKRSRRYEGFGG